MGWYSAYNIGSYFDYKMKRIFIVIAAFNEEKSIAKVIDDLHKHGYKNLVVVDDCSRDKTSKVALKKKAIVLRHIVNRGQGAALKTGIGYALENGADYIVTFDGDRQHHANEIKNLLKPLETKKVSVALGSRFLKDNDTLPFIRRMVLKMGVLVMWILYGIKLTDSHNGFRALSRRAAELIEITSDRMEHASQIVEEINKKNISYVEVPVTITYSDYSLAKGQRSFNSIKIGLKMLFRKFFH